MHLARPRKWTQGNIDVTGDLRCLNSVEESAGAGMATNAPDVVQPPLGLCAVLFVSHLTVLRDVGGAYQIVCASMKVNRGCSYGSQILKCGTSAGEATRKDIREGLLVARERGTCTPLNSSGTGR